MGEIRCSVCGKTTDAMTAKICPECLNVMCESCASSSGELCNNCFGDLQMLC